MKKVAIAPPKFRQNIKVKTGIALSAINGPEVPIPKTPILNRIESALFGKAKCFLEFIQRLSTRAGLRHR